VRTILCLALLLGLYAPARAIDIERVEPANWWSRHATTGSSCWCGGRSRHRPRLSRRRDIVDVQKTDNPKPVRHRRGRG
jgi:hypothetical protein